MCDLGAHLYNCPAILAGRDTLILEIPVMVVLDSEVTHAIVPEGTFRESDPLLTLVIVCW
jgi:hypothetical protein